MIENLPLHPKTKSAVKTYLGSPSQVLVIIGASGSGKHTLSRNIALKLLGLSDLEKLENEPRLILISREDGKSEIAIDTIRQLIKSLRLKQHGEGARRVIIIDQADSLSHEAQNALLKTLEQPSSGTLFILTSDNLSQLLPTVVSRSQKLTVYPIAQEQALASYGDRHAEATIKKAWLLSEGAAGHLHSLLEDKDEQPLQQATDSAKDFLAAPPYTRLAMVDGLAKDKDRLISLLNGLSRILKVLHHNNVRNGKTAMAQRLLKARKLVAQSQEALERNASAKLVLLKLIVNLKV